MTEPTSPETQIADLTYEQALQLAIQLHRRSQFDSAERLYRTLRQAAPDDPNPTHYLGVLLHQRGRNEEGIDLIQQSIGRDPTVASWHNNLGNVLLDAGKIEAATGAYTRCTELDPENTEVLNNLGVMLRNRKRFDEAEATFKRAIAKSPQFTNAHTNLASLLYQLGRIKEGHEHIAAVLALEPLDPTARKTLGLLYATLGRLDEAATIFREWLQHDPNSDQAKHHLAACTRENMPDRAPERYVERVFDSFAGSFDSKLATLEYRAPGIVGEAVAKLLGPFPLSPTLSILDAGCGTGLCAPFLLPYAKQLIGVDLSGNMLERARARGQYTELLKADLVAYLESCDANQDIIVSADTLCYFGRIDEMIQASHKALRTDGPIIFTVEAHEDKLDYRLNPNGRYSHHGRYLKRVLTDHGFVLLSMDSVNLRNESGQPVKGWLVVGSKGKGKGEPGVKGVKVRKVQFA